MTGSWIKEEKWLKINICIDFFLEIYPGYAHCLEFQDSVSFCKIPTFFMHKMQFNTFSCCTVFLHFEMWSKHKKIFGDLGPYFLDSQHLDLDFISVQEANFTVDLIILTIFLIITVPVKI